MRTLIDDVRIRWVFCLAVIGISVFLIGSVRVNSERKMVSRRAVNRETCREAAALYFEALPAESREAWKNLLEKNPELALRAETGKLYEIGTVE